MQQGFPQDIERRVAYDPTLFVKASIRNVIQTLAEAMVLVVLVVLLFLQNWRAALIPIAAVPVSLIGTLAVMQLAGFTLNTLSLFDLILSRPVGPVLPAVRDDHRDFDGAVGCQLPESVTRRAGQLSR